MNRSRLLTLIIFLVALVSCKNDLNNREIDKIFTHLEKNSPGVAVAITKGDKIIYKNGFGSANLEYGIPIGPETVFHVASLSKQFTAFSILLLEERGELNIEDDIREYIPEFPDYGETIKIKHLLTHSSGIRDQWDLLSMAGWRMDDVITMDHILNIISRQKKLNFSPGENFLYSNTGYTLLAEIVSRVSTKSFYHFTMDNIFKPLKMRNTQFYDDHERIIENRAYSYRRRGYNSFKKCRLNYSNVGATSLFTTAEDLALWSINLHTYKVGGKELIDRFNKIAVLNSGRVSLVAPGQFVGNYKGFVNIRHGGGDAGYRTYLTRIPEKEISVIVLSNYAEGEPWQLSSKVLDILLENETPAVEPVALNKNIMKVTVDKAILESYAGNYELKPQYKVTISFDGSLKANVDSNTFPLTAISDTEFLSPTSWHYIKFNSDNSIYLESGGKSIRHGKKKEDFSLATVDLEQYIGRYYSEELATEYNITIKDNRLIIRNFRLGEEVINLFARDRFDINWLFYGTIDIIRDNNKITGFEASTTSGRVQRVWFEKID